LQVLRSKTLNRYYSLDPARPPPMVAALESEFRALIGTRFALAVTSGTAALEVALGALGVGPGDEVILTAWSWISCFTAIVHLGGTPVLAEIDDTLCLDPAEIDRLHTPRTKAVLVVHYQGVAADMDPIMAAANRLGIAVVEDCAQSPGVVYRGRRGGSIGAVGAFSFQHLKTITAGEGGMFVTNDPRLYERAVRMHDLGQMRAFHAKQAEPVGPAFSATQFRMSELTGAVALAQFRRLDRIRARCRALSARVLAQTEGLRGLTFRRIPDPSGDSGIEIYFMLAETRLRDAFRAQLAQARVPCAPMTGTHAQYRRQYVVTGLSHSERASPFPVGAEWPGKGYRAEDFPKTEDLIGRIISIPIGVNYSDGNADFVGAEIRRIHGEIGL